MFGVVQSSSKGRRCFSPRLTAFWRHTMRKTCFVLVMAYLSTPTYGDIIEPLDIRSYSFGLVGGQYDFHLAFNRAPDFFTVDQFGRQADSFQFNINITSELPFHWVFDTDVLVRGGEIYLGG